MNTKRQYNRNSDFGPPNKKPKQNVDVSSRFCDAPIASSRPAKFSRPHPSMANAKDRNKAKRILKRHRIAPITEEQASSRQDFLRIQEDVKWAMAVLPFFLQNYETTQAHEESKRENLIVKLQIPPQEVPNITDGNPYNISSSPPPTEGSMLEEQSLESVRDKSCEISVKSTFADIARGRTIIGLIDRGNLEGKISRNRWDWIQASLASVTLEVLRENPGPPPSCKDAGWFQGNIKLIACDNDRSALLYRWAIAKIGEVYPGAQLEVVDIMDIPSRPWATAWLPETPSESAEILVMLSALNPELPMQDWKVIKADKFERDMMLVIFQINHLSIEQLTRCDGLLNYASNKIRMQFYKSPHDALSNLEAFAAAVDPPSNEDELEMNDSHLNMDLSFLSDCGDSLD